MGKKCEVEQLGIKKNKAACNLNNAPQKTNKSTTFNLIMILCIKKAYEIKKGKTDFSQKKKPQQHFYIFAF